MALAAGRPAMILERPDIFGSSRATAPLEVSGWAWSGLGIESVVVSIDGEIEIDAARDLYRPDLRRLFGDALATSGFCVHVDPRDWAPGPHELCVVATDRAGRAIGVAGAVESIPRRAAGGPAHTGPDGAIDPLPNGGGRDQRFVPSIHRRAAPTPELYARYRWAAHAVRGANVLDVGCGTGTGAALLAEHAGRVTGVDRSSEAIVTATPRHRAVAFQQADLLDLPFAAGEFDAVVCFETIEQVADTARALDELQRVLAPNGVLLISSANRGVYPPGNPLHLSELSADELRAALEARFANVATHHQQTYAASLICDSGILAHDDPTQPIPTTTTKTTAHPPDTALYTIATATNGTPPTPPAHHELTLGAPLDERERRRLAAVWKKRCIQADRKLAEARSEELFQRGALAARLERLDATETELRERIAVAERRLARDQAATATLLRSASWRLTAPLRKTKRGIRAVRGGAP